MKIVSVVGARPQFIKLAPMQNALAARNHDHYVVHTGQHYDSKMSADIFQDLAIDDPYLNLKIGSGTHAQQTGKMLELLEAEFLRLKPEVVLVYGDTNSTLAATLAASKIHIPVAHLEAGLRSFNRRMPEEQNRIVADHLSELLLAPTALAVRNLSTEGLANRTVLIGDVMLDICNQIVSRDDQAKGVLPDVPFALATIHRAENTDNKVKLLSMLKNINDSGYSVILLAHPRLVASLPPNEKNHFQNIKFVDPVPYSQLLRMAKAAELVITDSGGLQKEAFFLGTPCVTLRAETEWVETVDSGWNILSPTGQIPPNFANNAASKPRDLTAFGGGNASVSAVQAIEKIV